MGLKGSKSFLFLVVFLSLGNHCYRGLGVTSATSIIDKMDEVSCNGTIENCFSSDDEFEGGEFLRHYAAGGRWLLQTEDKISYRSLQKPPVCTTRQYSNCVMQSNNGNHRPCTVYNRCKHPPSG